MGQPEANGVLHVVRLTAYDFHAHRLSSLHFIIAAGSFKIRRENGKIIFIKPVGGPLWQLSVFHNDCQNIAGKKRTQVKTIPLCRVSR